LNRDLPDLNVDVRGAGVLEIALDCVVLPVCLGNAVSELGFHEKQRPLEVVARRVAVPAVIEPAEIAQEILDLGVLGLITKRVVLDGLRAANVVDADYKRLEILDHANS